METIKERPILFSTPMVQGLLDDRKGMTRRVMKQPPPENIEELLNKADALIDGMSLADQITQAYQHGFLDIKCPHGVIGDRLWVKETWSDINLNKNAAYLHYKADKANILTDWELFEENIVFANSVTDLSNVTGIKYRPSIFMPRIASRILLEITNIRVEQLNDISEADALAEGIHWNEINEAARWCRTPIDVFKELWESINGAGSWSKNPWVWVVEFKVLEIKK